MTDKTIHDLSGPLTTPASDDEVGVWDASAGQYVRCTLATLIGATLLNGGSLDLNNKSAVLPASGSLALIDVAQTFSAEQVIAPGVCSQRSVTINDDAVLSFAVARSGWLLIGTLAGGFANRHAIIAFRAGATPYTGVVAQPSTVYEVSTSVLTGTTGTDGKITVSATGGTLYIENRSGGAYAFTFLIIQ